MIETICCVSGLVIVAGGIIILGIYNRRRIDKEQNENEAPITHDDFILGYKQEETENERYSD